MKSRTFYSAIAVFAGLLVLIGVAGFWGLTAQNPKVLITQGGQVQPLAAQFVPRQSPVMVSLLARPDRLWQLRQLLTPAGDRAAARQEWQSLQQSLEELMGWDYEADVRPWLDEEATLAVTTADLDHDADNGLQPGYLVVLSCRDADAARAALHLLWQQRAAQGRSLVFETVAGVPLISDRPLVTMATSRLSAPASDLALATLATGMVGDRYVLLANDVQVLRQAIQTYQAPDVSLAKAADYRAAIAALPPNRVGWVYANVPSFLTWLGLTNLDSQRPVRPQGEQLDSLFFSFQALKDGLLGNVAIARAPGAPPIENNASSWPTGTSPETLLALLPADTLLATTGPSLNQRLQTLDSNIGGYPLTQSALQSALASLLLDPMLVSRDLAAHWQGEYALGLLPGSRPDWVLMTRSRTADLTAVDDFASAQGLTVSHIPYQEQAAITVWTRLALTRSPGAAPLSLSTQVVAVHAPVQGYEVFSTSLDGLQSVWQQSSAAPLPNRTTFAQLVKQFDQLGDNLTYLDWPSVSPRLTQRLPWLRALEVAGQPLTGHIGPLLISSKPTADALPMGAIAIKLMENPRKTSE